MIAFFKKETSTSVVNKLHMSESPTLFDFHDNGNIETFDRLFKTTEAIEHLVGLLAQCMQTL